MPTRFLRAVLTRRAVLATLAFGVVASLLSGAVSAQVLHGDWVDESEKAIDKHRKTGVAVIVLDQNDRAIKGANVQLTQRRHDFVLGLSIPADRKPPKGVSELPVYRCFNAIALDRLTDWSADPLPLDEQAALLNSWSRSIDPIRTAFGRVISADPAKNTDKLSRLSPPDLRDAVLARISLAAVYEPQPDDYDLYADLLNQDMIERKLGVGMINRMFERAQALRPKAGFSLRMRNAISLSRGRELARVVQRMEIRQIPFDRVTIEQRFIGQVQPLPLQRMLDEYLRPMPVPVTFAGLEVGGSSAVAAGINMETVLRLAYARPEIDGLFLSGLDQEHLIEEHAALLDEDGKPTAAGKALDDLFFTHWRSTESGVTDERGNVQKRVFTGWYEVTATLPDGTKITNEAYIPKAEREKVIVLQMTTAEWSPKR